MAKTRTILQQNIQALLHQEVGIEDNQTERERQHIIAGADLEEVPDCFLDKTTCVSACFLSWLPSPPLSGPVKQPFKVLTMALAQRETVLGGVVPPGCDIPGLASVLGPAHSWL